MDPVALARMRPVARREFEAKYTAGTNYRQLTDIYERAVEIAARRRVGDHPPAATGFDSGYWG